MVDSVYPMPEVWLIPEHTIAGTIYKPDSEKAYRVADLIGTFIQDHHLPRIEALGFIIAFRNKEPLKYPHHAYKRAAFQRPKHIDDRI